MASGGWSAFRIVSVITLGLGLILVGLAQAFPWESVETNPDNEFVEFVFGDEPLTLMDAYQWGATLNPDDLDEFSNEGTFGVDKCTDDWFSEDCGTEDSDPEEEGTVPGERELKAGFILMVIGGAFALGAFLWSTIHSRGAVLRVVLAYLAFVVYLVSAVLTVVGMDDFTAEANDGSEDSDGDLAFETRLGAGTILGFIGAPLLLVGAIMETLRVAIKGKVQSKAPSRNITCPRCNHNADYPIGVVPQCPSCGLTGKAPLRG